MGELQLGLLVAAATILVLLLGVPVAFALGGVAIAFLWIFEGSRSLPFIPDIFFGGLNDFALLSVPMFILMGGAIASSRAGSDLYEAIDRWMDRVPGGLLLSNIAACGVFAALSGSSPATCAAIGKMGIPAMRQRGYPNDLAAGAVAAGGTLGILIPPSVTMIVYGIATETSIGRLFLAGLLPGMMLTILFMIWGVIAVRRSHRPAVLAGRHFSWAERMKVLPRVLPFVAVIAGILWVLYGGVATPSEAAGIGAVLCLVLVALIYRMVRPRDLWPVFRDTTRESVMILMIVASSALFSYMMSSLFITQALAMWIAELEMNRWVLFGIINLFLIVAGLFLPPVAVIVMTAPTLLPIIDTLGFDPVWFGVIMTINMEIGLITPPVGLNLYVINAIAPDVKLKEVLRGALPFMLCMILGIAILCLVPDIALWLPNRMLGG
jgi:tripartite ATP-independent transporter DctM subunit